MSDLSARDADVLQFIFNESAPDPLATLQRTEDERQSQSKEADAIRMAEGEACKDKRVVVFLTFCSIERGTSGGCRDGSDARD